MDRKYCCDGLYFDFEWIFVVGCINFVFCFVMFVYEKMNNIGEMIFKNFYYCLKDFFFFSRIVEILY